MLASSLMTGTPNTSQISPEEQVAYIISKNIKRRHLTKQQQADLIVAAIKAGQKPPQNEAVSKGGRGKVNPVKQKAIAAGKKHGISKATVERSLAKAEGRKPKLKPKHSKSEQHLSDLITAWEAADEDARRKFLAPLGDSIEEARAVHDQVVELRTRNEPTRAGNLSFLLVALLEDKKKQASTLPQDGRSEVPVDDPTPQNEGDDDLGDIPVARPARAKIVRAIRQARS